jgi:predicted RNase H-like HicB family nuclease
MVKNCDKDQLINVLNYRILLREEPEVGFTVFIPSLEGCIIFGSPLKETKKNTREAIVIYIESSNADNIPIPPDENLLKYNLQITDV